MAKPEPRCVLFLDSAGNGPAHAAALLFNATAARMGLPWQALSRTFDSTSPAAADAELQRAARIVSVHEAAHRAAIAARVPAQVECVEYWSAADAAGIERKVAGLVARLLGGRENPEPDAGSERGPQPAAAKPAKKPLTAKVGRETAGRRGKGVTTVFDLRLTEDQLRELAADLKQRCGTGGTVKDGRIEIQGDQRDRIVAELEKLGYQVKRAGG